MYKMESAKEQFLPLCYSVYTLTKLSSYYDVQRLDAKSRVSIWASGYMQMILFCFLLAGNGENFAKATKLKGIESLEQNQIFKPEYL